MNKNYLRRPKDYHIPCSVKGCINMYNNTQKESDDRCKPCREKEKKERE